MFWDRVAGVYDLFANHINRRANGALCAAVAEEIRPEDEVLECACGTGLLSGVIAERCRSLVATDLSEKMLQVAQRKFGSRPNLTFRQGDILHIDFPDESFDAVVAANVIHLLKEPERALAEMFQRSRPVVREALRMLQQEGLIETAVGSSGGAVIRGVSLKSVEEPLKNLVAMGAINLDELLEYRHINDRSCARLAAIHHTEEDAEALRQTLEGAKANLDSLFSFQEYDVAFHSALAKASHNTLASLINDVIVRLNTDVFVETIRDYTPEQLREINLRIYNTHYAIMEAVLAHDPDGADRAVAAMVRLFQDTVH